MISPLNYDTNYQKHSKIVTGLIFPHPAQLLALFTNSLLAVEEEEEEEEQ